MEILLFLLKECENLATSPNTPAPIQESRISLKDRAYEVLKQRILDGELPAGSLLSERQVAKWLEMSKTPIQAAFHKLEMDGLVSVAPQQGVRVRDYSVAESVAHFELRVALETYVVRELAGRLTDEQVQALRDHLAKQHESVRSRDIERNVELDRAFHLLMCECLGNQEIVRVMWQLRDKIHRVVANVHVHHPGRLEEIYPEHVAIVDALIDGDGDLAAELIAQHIRISARWLRS